MLIIYKSRKVSNIYIDKLLKAFDNFVATHLITNVREACVTVVEVIGIELNLYTLLLKGMYKLQKENM